MAPTQFTPSFTMTKVVIRAVTSRRNVHPIHLHKQGTALVAESIPHERVSAQDRNAEEIARKSNYAHHKQSSKLETHACFRERLFHFPLGNTGLAVFLGLPDPKGGWPAATR